MAKPKFCILAIAWVSLSFRGEAGSIDEGSEKMTASYQSFKALSQREVEGVDYRIRVRLRDERVFIMAPHGGKIEPTTSLIAEAIANLECKVLSYNSAGDHSIVVGET